MPKELQYVLLTLGTEMYCRLCVLLYMYIVKTITTIYYCKTCIINKTSRRICVKIVMAVQQRCKRCRMNVLSVECCMQ